MQIAVFLRTIADGGQETAAVPDANPTPNIFWEGQPAGLSLLIHYLGSVSLPYQHYCMIRIYIRPTFSTVFFQLRRQLSLNALIKGTLPISILGAFF